LLAFFLGSLGIHRFYLGYTAIGIVMLSVCVVGSFLCCGLGAMVTSVWSLVEFVLILVNQLPDSNGQSLE
jgi:TM2 domain-containing membrane protein YozV